jgi:hypothetical protein
VDTEAVRIREYHELLKDVRTERALLAQDLDMVRDARVRFFAGGDELIAEVTDRELAAVRRLAEEKDAQLLAAVETAKNGIERLFAGYLGCHGTTELLNEISRMLSPILQKALTEALDIRVDSKLSQFLERLEKAGLVETVKKGDRKGGSGQISVNRLIR